MPPSLPPQVVEKKVIKILNFFKTLKFFFDSAEHKSNNVDFTLRSSSSNSSTLYRVGHKKFATAQCSSYLL